MKKRIKLRGWVLVVLKIILLIDMFIMACSTNDLSIMCIKTLITFVILVPILYLLIKYGDLDGND